MSLESGKKLGITASLIAVVMPFIGVVAYVFLIFSSVIGSISQGANSAVPSDFIIILLVVFGIIVFAGLILFVVAMHRLSQYYNESGIYKKTLYGFIINIVGAGAVAALLFYFAFLSSAHSISQGTTQTTAATPLPTMPSILNYLGVIISLLLALVVVTVAIGVVSAVFYMRAFNLLGEKSGVDNFKTAGLLYLLGTVLSIVGVGVLLIWIAWILALIGFNSLKPKIFETSTFAYPTSTPQAAIPDILQKRFCPYCGTENIPGSHYCRFCGKQLQ